MNQNKILIKLLTPLKKFGVEELCLHSGMHHNLLTIPDLFLVSQGVHLLFTVQKVPRTLTQNLVGKNVFQSGNFMENIYDMNGSMMNGFKHKIKTLFPFCKEYLQNKYYKVSSEFIYYLYRSLCRTAEKMGGMYVCQIMFNNYIT